MSSPPILHTSRFQCTSQSRSEIEEAAVRDTVLVCVTTVEGENLPPETSSACRSIPSRCLCVEISLGKGEPSGGPLWRVFESCLRSGHRSHSPESLIVVSQRLCLIQRHEVSIIPCLM